MKKTALLEQKTNKEAFLSEQEHYQEMPGSLIFSIVKTKPDIAFATSISSCFAKNLGQQHTEAVKMILQYLKVWGNKESPTIGKASCWKMDTMILTGQETKKLKVEFRFYFHVQPEGGKLVFKETINSRLHLYLCQIYFLDAGHKRSHLTSPPAQRAYSPTTRPTIYSNQGLGKKQLCPEPPSWPGYCTWEER